MSVWDGHHRHEGPTLASKSFGQTAMAIQASREALGATNAPPPRPALQEDSMNEDPLALALASTDFEPEDLQLADLFLGHERRPTVALGAPAMISTGLNSADLAFVYLNIDPPGEPLVASEWEDPRLTRSVWLDLRPAEALELGTRLRICAEAAAQFAEACAAGPDGADGEDDQAVGP